MLHKKEDLRQQAKSTGVAARDSGYSIKVQTIIGVLKVWRL
jgi:hypothetical protein